MGDLKSSEHLKQALANVTDDSRLTNGEKTSAEALAREQHARLHNGTETQPDTWNNACAVRIAALSQAATTLTGTATDVLGNIWAKRPFQRAVAGQLTCSNSEAQRLVEIALRPVARLSRAERQDLQIMRDQVRLRSRDAWLFQNDATSTNPYDGIDLGRLPCAMGLPYSMGEEFVAFSVPFPAAIVSRRPCVYDADWSFQEFWRPQGRTKPICVNLPSLPGHPEWICAPPRLAELDPTLRTGAVTDCPPPGAHSYD